MTDMHSLQPTPDGGLPPRPASSPTSPLPSVEAYVDALLSQVGALPPAELKLFGVRFDEMRRVAAAPHIVRLSLHGLPYGGGSAVADVLQGIVAGRGVDTAQLPRGTPIVSILRHAKDTLGTVLRVHADAAAEASALPNPIWVRAALEKFAQQHQLMRDSLRSRAFDFFRERGVFEEGEILLLETTVNRAIDEQVPFFRFFNEIEQLEELLEPHHPHYAARALLVRGACEALLAPPRGFRPRVGESEFITQWQRAMASSLDGGAGVLSKLVQLRLWYPSPLNVTDLRLLAQLSEDRYSFGSGVVAAEGFQCWSAAPERGPVVQPSALSALSPPGSADTVPDIVRVLRGAGIQGCEVTFHRMGGHHSADAKVTFTGVVVPPFSLKAAKPAMTTIIAPRLRNTEPFSLAELQAVLKIARRSVDQVPPSEQPLVLPPDKFEARLEALQQLSLAPGLLRQLSAIERSFVVEQAGRTLPFSERIEALLTRVGFFVQSRSVDGRVARFQVNVSGERGGLSRLGDNQPPINLTANPLLLVSALEQMIDLTRPEDSRKTPRFESAASSRKPAVSLNDISLSVDEDVLLRLNPVDQQQLAVVAGEALPIELGIAAIFRQAGFREAFAERAVEASSRGLALAYRYFDPPSMR